MAMQQVKQSSLSYSIIRMRKIAYNVIFIGSMVPVIPMLKSGTVPYSIVLIFLWYLLRCRVYKKVFYINIIVICFICFMGFLHGGGCLGDYILLLVGPNIFAYFYYSEFLPSKKLLKWFIVGSLVIAVAIEPSALLSTRGVHGLYSEPSHFGRYVIVAIIILSLLWRKSVFILYVLPVFIVNKSASALAVYLASLFDVRHVIKTVVAGFILILGIVMATIFFSSDVRMLQQVSRIEQAMNSSSKVDAAVLDQIGSRRLLQAVVGYAVPFDMPLGADDNVTLAGYSRQIGLPLSSVEYIAHHLTDINALKPGSYLSEWFFDFGIPGAFVAIFMVSFFIYRGFKAKMTGPVAAGIFMLALLSTTTMLAPWVLLGVILNKRARLLSQFPRM